MSKLTIVFALAAFVCYINAHPAPHFDDAFFSDLSFPVMPTMKPFVFPDIEPLTADDIKKLHPDGDNDHVEGISVSSHSSQKTVNGKLVKDTKGSKAVINDNGKVEEYSSGD